MRILLTNNHLDAYGGTEVWLTTIYSALEKLGHEVDVYTHLPKGEIFAHLREYDPDATYDVAVINHNTCLRDLEGRKNIAKRIFTCHGVIPNLEKPVAGADYYVGVSEETAELCKKSGFNATVIRNPIDVDVFREQRPINRTLKTVLYLSTHGGAVRETIQKACEGLEFIEIGGIKKSGSVQDWINEADLVIALGRGAYEALSCRRNVIVFDYLGGDGFIDERSIHLFNKHNCSGRTRRVMFTPEQLRELFERYDPEQDLRGYVASEHDAIKVAKKYLRLPI